MFPMLQYAQGQYVVNYLTGGELEWDDRVLCDRGGCGCLKRGEQPRFGVVLTWNKKCRLTASGLDGDTLGVGREALRVDPWLYDGV